MCAGFKSRLPTQLATPSRAPASTQIAAVSGAPTTVTYLAPYGEVSFTGTAPAYRVSVTNGSGARPAVVGVVGVTGKVVSYDE